MGGSTGLDQRVTEAEKLVWGIRVASRYMSWNSNCLDQTLAGKRMLQRCKLASTLFLWGYAGRGRGGVRSPFLARLQGFPLTCAHDQSAYSMVLTFPNDELCTTAPSGAVVPGRPWWPSAPRGRSKAIPYKSWCPPVLRHAGAEPSPTWRMILFQGENTDAISRLRCCRPRIW